MSRRHSGYSLARVTHPGCGTGTVTAMNTASYAIGDTATLLPTNSGVVFQGRRRHRQYGHVYGQCPDHWVIFNGTNWYLK